jgi:hypothetical protein
MWSSHKKECEPEVFGDYLRRKGKPDVLRVVVKDLGIEPSEQVKREARAEFHAKFDLGIEDNPLPSYRRLDGQLMLL